MLDFSNPYKPSSPQQPIIKRRRLRLSSVPLVDLRSTSLPGTNAECEEIEARFCVTGSPRTFSHFLMHAHGKSGICSTAENMENPRGATSGKIQHLTHAWDGQSRFPKLDECAHFHYEFVELGPIQVNLYDITQENVKTLPISDHEKGENFSVQVTSSSKMWVVRRTYENFRLLDEQLHRCIYDRKFSLLAELPDEIQIAEGEIREDILRIVLTEYLERFSAIAGNLINCGPILNWFELDNRGNHLIIADDSAINTPAVAAAYVTKRYTAQASDEISFEVGDMISVIDMPPPEESIWWRGKKGFEVGFFPCECVEIIGDKVPHSINIPKAPTKPVLRKHGKLISFFRSFILSRPSRRKLKQSGILKERVFGCDLGEHLLNSGHEIPMVLICCAEFIEEHGIVDGIYRLSGITSNIQKLRLAFDEDRVPNLNDAAILQDIHCVASLLKMYFRELPNPLLTYQLYDRFVLAVQSEENIRLINMRDVVQQLPPPHYRTLEYLVKHLAKVASHGAETGMTPKNVAIVWAPNLLRSKELEIGSVAALQVVGIQAIVTEFLIRYVDLIFNEKLPTFCSSSGADGTPKKSRPKSLAISTPTKLLSLEEARSRALNVNVQSQPKYIEVGGGPANLPSKYHTVIELPSRKRGNVKLKKSPSGWKSFFSKGKSQYSKEKPKPSLSPGNSPIGSNRESVFNEVDTSVPNGRNLRSVKSAESLTSTISNINRNSDRSSKTIPSFDNSFKLVISQANNMESHPRSIVKISPHSHIRSISHDSYFETSPEAEIEIRNLPVKSMKRDLEESSSCLEMDDFEDVATDINHIHIDYDNDYDFISTGADEIVESSEPLNDKASRTQIDITNSEFLQKSPKKYRWKCTESVSPKSKLSLKEKFKQTFASPSLSRKMYSSGSESSEESSLKSTLKRTPSLTKETVVAEAAEDRFSLIEAAMAEGEQSYVMAGSPSQSPKTKQPKWTNVIDKTVTDTVEKERVDAKSNQSCSSEKIIVERYGSEKTVLVEVHASECNEEDQDSSSVPDKFYNVFHSENIYNPSILSPMSCHSSLLGECGSVASISATISETEIMSLNRGEFLEVKDTDLGKSPLEQTSPETESQYNSTISTPTSATKENIFEVMDTDTPTTYDHSFSAEIISSFHVDESSTTIDSPQCKLIHLPCTGVTDQSPEKIHSSHLTMSSVNKTNDDSEFIDHIRSMDLTEFNKYIHSPMDRFDSESSTASFDTSGEGREGSAIEDNQKNAFGYMKLIDEIDCGSNEEDSQSLLKPMINEERNSEYLYDGINQLESPCSSTIEENLLYIKDKNEIDTDSSSSELICLTTENQVNTKYVKDSKDVKDSLSPSSLHVTNVDDSKKSLSPRSKLSDFSVPERLPSSSSYLSPLDESKRKFESEIGRDILHERKMKLELEKIQLEQKLEKISPSATDSRNAFPLSSPYSMKLSPSIIGNDFSKEDFHENEVFSEVIEGSKRNNLLISPSDCYGSVELRPSKDATEEIKRKSEPLTCARNEPHLPVQNKRYSEPQLGSISYRHAKLEKKTSIKELMSKFENSSAIDTDITNGQKVISLKTGIPQLLLQSDTESDERAMTSVKAIYSSIIDKEKENENEIETKFLGGTPQESYSSVKVSLDGEFLFPKESDSSKTFLCSDKHSVDRVMKKEKLSLRLSAPCELSVTGHSVKATQRTVESDEIFKKTDKSEDNLTKEIPESMLSATSDINDIARRERIDKYKEERRAQLREKIRSESFRLDKEEKSDILNKIKHKTVSPVKSEDHTLSKFKLFDLTETKHPNKNLKPAIIDPDYNSSTNVVTTRPSHYVESEKKNLGEKLHTILPTGKIPLADRPIANLLSSESEQPLNHETLQRPMSAFLRTVPGRRSLRTGSESEAVDFLRHSNRCLQLKSNLENSDRMKMERTIVKELTPSKPKSLPLQEPWAPSTEHKDSTSVSLRQLHSPLKERNLLLQEKEPPLTKISPVNRQRSLPCETLSENSAAISPPNRIREVAALFEKESSGQHPDSGGAKVKFAQIGQSAVTSARARFLSQNDPSLDNDKDCVKRKPSQYLSAV